MVKRKREIGSLWERNFLNGLMGNLNEVEGFVSHFLNDDREGERFEVGRSVV
jgi:hypothetical protein